MSQPRQLYLLQQLDTQLDKSRARLSEIDRALNDSSVMQRAIAQAEKAEKHFQQSQIALKHAEQDVETQQTKITNNQRALYGGAVTNPKELEDLQMESAALKRHLATLEDVLLEKMVAFEDAEDQHKQAQSQLETTRQETADENVELTKEQAVLLDKVAQLSAERDEASAPIDPESLALYLKLRESKAGIAVSEVVDNSCKACGFNLTAAQAQAARSPNKITTCESCRRILYSK
jgi:predicted  nucleic acid-binding Zn-ribbon protein